MLLLEFLSDLEAERNGTLLLGAALGMIAAQRNQLLADGAAVIDLASARARVLHHALHLVTTLCVTVGVATLGRVTQRLDAALDRLAPRFDRVQLSAAVSLRVAIVQVEAKSLHRMRMIVFLVACDAQIKILCQSKPNASF